ncbi:MAG: glycine cleavage system aminomethyltransferase GcvT [Coriobacteriia bacterium]|nr:glycine cleavage system aminomethyltransferase GcvT [Coriobacteriia bacterium]
MALKTPLYDEHLALGGKMVEFAGYDMPVQYKAGINKEHLNVREHVGIFDASHMGEFFLTGPESREQLNEWFTNSYTNLQATRIRYSVMTNEEGGALDDLIVYCFDDEKFMIVVNASNREADYEWLSSRITKDVKLEDKSDEYALIAIQGPQSKEVLSKICDPEQLPAKYYSFTENVEIHGVPCLISQTGYTGEFGYEIYCPASAVVGIWNLILKAGEEFDILPAGLGARDTLRLEAGMPLYGNELTPDTTPLEAGLGFAVKLDKDDFIGKKGIEEKLPLKKVRVGFEVVGKGIVREHAPLFKDDKEIGFSTSGTMAPYLGKAIGMAYVLPEYAEEGIELNAQVRNKNIPVKIVPLPFYSRS